MAEARRYDPGRRAEAKRGPGTAGSAAAEGSDDRDSSSSDEEDDVCGLQSFDWCRAQSWVPGSGGEGIAAARRRQTAERHEWDARVRAEQSAGTDGWADSKARGIDRDGAWYPLVRPRPAKMSGTVANDTVSATEEWIRRKAVPPIQWKPPRTRVIPVRSEQRYTGALPYPHELPGPDGEHKWLAVQEWCRAYRAEWLLVERGKEPGQHPHRFDVTKIPGGRQGLVIKDFLADEYKDWVWDLRPWLESGAVRGAGPRCVPLVPIAAQENSEWKLEALEADAAAAEYTDENIVFELCRCGIRSHSAELDENTCVLMPNYAGFWKPGAPEFVASKCDEDRTGFKVPRLTGGYQYPAFMNARVHPRGVAVQVNSETGEVRMRLTVDEGAPRAPHGQEWDDGESVAWNDGIDLDDPARYPAIKYASVDKYARGLAVLAASGIAIGQTKTDIRCYYRTLARYWREHGVGQQWCTLEKMIEQDSRLQFGARGNPNAASRVTGLLWSLIEIEIDAAQREWEAEGRVPAEVRERLAAWAAERELAVSEHWAAVATRLQADGLADAEVAEQLAEQRRGEGRADRWFTGNFYIDDLFAGSFDWFIEEVQRCMLRVLIRYDVEAADGRLSMWSGEHIKNKTELCRAGDACNGAMEVLGVLLSPATRRRSITRERAERYVTAGKALVWQEAAAGKAPCRRRVVNRTALQSWVGKVIFASCAIPALRSGFQALLATLQQGWSSRNAVALGRAAWSQVDLLCSLLELGRGCALWPNRAAMGAGGRTVVWTFGDAARDPLAPASQHVGFGVWWWTEGDTVAHSRTGRWSAWEQQLCPTSLELHTMNMVLAWALSERPAGEEWDVLQVTDSSSAKDVAMRVHARSAAERVLLQRRVELLAQHERCRCAAVHAHREFLQDCDDGSKGKLSSMHALLQERFDGGVDVQSGGVMPQEWRALEPVVEAKREAEAAPLAKASRGRRGSKRKGGSKRL